MSFRWILSLISSQLHRNMHGFHKLYRNVQSFKKGIRKYISCSESRFWLNEPHSELGTHENYVFMHTQSSFIHNVSKRARILRKAIGSAIIIKNHVSGLMNHIRCYGRMKIMFRCIPSPVSSMMRRKVQWFQRNHSDVPLALGIAFQA